MISNTNLKNIMTKTQTTDFFLACKESRIENNTSFYGCFYLGPFDDSLSQTLANDLRRTLLSELTGLAITSIEIEGILHKFSSLPGMKESVLDLICNLQSIVLKKQDIIKSIPLRSTKKTYTGFLNVSGPRVIKAIDLKLPAGLQCVDPNQYVATLAEDGFLNMKFNINEGKNFIKQKPHNLDVTVLKKRNILLQNFKKKVASSSVALLGASFPSVSIAPEGRQATPPQRGRSEQQQTAGGQLTFPLKGHKGQPEGKDHLAESVGSKDNLKTNRRTFKSSISNPISLDAVFMPVTKINCIIEENNIYSDFSTDPVNFYNQTLDGNLPLRPKNNLLSSNVIYKKHQISDRSYTDFQAFLNAMDYNSIYQTCLVLQKNNNNMIDEEHLGLDSTHLWERMPLAIDPSLKNNKQIADSQEKKGAIYPNHLKLIPWQSNTLYFDIKDDLADNSLYPLWRTTQEQSEPSIRYLLPSGDVNQLVDERDRLLSLSPDGETPGGNVPKQKTKNYKNNYRLWLSKEHSSFSKIKTFLACKVVKNSQQLSVPNLTGEKQSNLYKQNKGTLSPTQIALASIAHQNKINTIKTALTKEKNSFKINQGSSLPLCFATEWQRKTTGGQNMYLEYAKNFKLKPLRKKSHLIVEIWTNGSIHPRQALYQSFIFLSNNFLKLQTVKMLGSMFKSEFAYGNLKYSILNNYSISKADQDVPLCKTSEFISSSFAFGKVNNSSKTSLNLMKFYSQASLKAPIGLLKISLRIYTALKKSGIFTLNDLVNYSKNDLLNIKNLGTKALVEIETSLSYLGLTLKN